MAPLLSSLALLPSLIAHIGGDATLTFAQISLAAVSAAWFLALALQHSYVKHGGLSARRVIAPIATVTALAVGAAVAPPIVSAQSALGPTGLPDLISDPPAVRIERELHDRNNNVVRVLAFDGLLHNIGAGALEVSGNPQIEGGVSQLVFDGFDWTEVATPPVQYETDDGHNHFHLMDAARYTLWTDAQTEEVAVAAKVGFCLLDTFQVERGADPGYSIEQSSYCNVDQPDTTELRMGISPGWVDLYESNITFQWIDVSNIAPGRYYVGSQVDPDNHIVESNDDNNVVVLSTSRYEVSGYIARPLPVQTEAAITLKSRVFGTPGQVAYVIVEPPTNGTLSVPTGYDILNPEISYSPNAGYEGPDSFSYFAHDTNTDFPFDPQIVTVEIDAASAMAAPEQAAVDATGLAVVADSATLSAQRFEQVALSVELTGDTQDSTPLWYASGLPAGLRIDPTSGMITGELTLPTETTSTIAAQLGQTVVETTIEWSVADRERISLRQINDLSFPIDSRQVLVGSGTAETQYEATGLPEGILLTPGQPTLIGTPTTPGDYDIVVNELLDGEIVDTAAFTLTVRPSTDPAFAL